MITVTFPDGSCLNPNSLQGVCIDILECPPLLQSLKNVERSNQETLFLQKSQCGRKGNSILVCCRLDSGSRWSVPTVPKTVNNTHLLPSTHQCGPLLDNRILGGKRTKIYEYPWLALIEYTKRKLLFFLQLNKNE